MQDSQNKKSATKRKRLTIEEQIAKQKELLAKEQESLEKKQKGLRSLNASKMNKDRKEAQKKRNSMLIQIGLFFIQILNHSNNMDKEKQILYYIELTKKMINAVNEDIEKNKNIYSDKTIKEQDKKIRDKTILLEALKNMKENYLKCGEVKIE